MMRTKFWHHSRIDNAILKLVGQLRPVEAGTHTNRIPNRHIHRVN